MSLHEFIKATELIDKDVPFYGLIMAAMLKADDENMRLLRQAWPEIHVELSRRYISRGGMLDEEREELKNAKPIETSPHKPINPIWPDGFSGDDEDV